MDNHYQLVRDIRKRMRLSEQIASDELIDYYWALHRLHEHQATRHEQLIAGSQNSQMERHVIARERHYGKAVEYKGLAEQFEDRVYPGISHAWKGVHNPEAELDTDFPNYQI